MMGRSCQDSMKRMLLMDNIAEWGSVNLVSDKVSLVPQAFIAKNICENGGTFALSLKNNKDKRLSISLVKWMNNVHLTYEQREALRQEFMLQGIFYVPDIANLDLPPLMKRIEVASQWVEDWAQHEEGATIHRKLAALKFRQIAEARDGQAPGHEVIVTLENAGGTIKSWLMSVSSNCGKVSMYFKQLCHFALTELEHRGLIPIGYEEKKDIMERLDLLHAEWSLVEIREREELRYVLFPSRIEQLFCKKAATFMLRVDLPNDSLLKADLVAWMNKLVLTFEQRSALRLALVKQKVHSLASFPNIQVEAVVKNVLQACPNCPLGFSSSIVDEIQTQKLRALGNTYTSHGVKELPRPVS